MFSLEGRGNILTVLGIVLFIIIIYVDCVDCVLIFIKIVLLHIIIISNKKGIN